MEFTLYIGSKKVKQAIGYILNKNACTRLSRTKGRYNLDKTLSKPRSTQKCSTIKRLSKLYLRIKLTQGWFQSSTSEQSKTNEQNEFKQNPHAQRLISF